MQCVKLLTRYYLIIPRFHFCIYLLFLSISRKVVSFNIFDPVFMQRLTSQEILIAQVPSGKPNRMIASLHILLVYLRLTAQLPFYTLFPCGFSFPAVK